MAELMKTRQAFYNTVHGPNHHWWVLLVTSMGTLMTTYDSGAVNISLPRIMTSFQTGLTTISWVMLSYLLTTSALLLPAGRLGDMLGRTKVYSFGFVVFILGSALCALSQNQYQLILFRILQGVGAALIQTNSFAIIADAFPERDRGKGLGFVSSIAAIGITSGPAIGGIIIDVAGWKGIFLLNIAVGLTGVVLSRLILKIKTAPKSKENTFRQFDLPGTCLAGMGIGALLIGLTFGQKGNWISLPTCFFLGAAFVAMTAFPLFEARRANPIIDMTLFKNRTFGFNNIARLICFVSISFNTLLMPFFLQIVIGYSPFHAGLLIAPVSLVNACVSPFSGWLTNYIRTKILASTGMALMGLSYYSLSQLNLSSDYSAILGRLVLLGLGYGIFQTPNNTSIMDSVESGRFGITSGILAFVRQTGLAVGTALASTIVVTSMVSKVGNVSLAGLRQDRNFLAQNGALESFSDGIGTAFLVAAFLCVIGIVFSLMRGKTDRDKGKHAH